MGISVKASVSETVNYAAVHCGEKIIKEITVTGDVSGNAVMRVSSDPAFLFEYRQQIVPGAGAQVFHDLELKIDDAFFRQEIIEAREGEIKIDILDEENPDKILGFFRSSVRIQPYLHWDAARSTYTMPAFMQPNDPLVGEVLKKAGEFANRDGFSMYGYQGNSEEEVVIQAECIYKALQTMGLHYISPPASFETTGQKIRIPHQVLHDISKQGTCLDLAVLYATCLEAASLNSAIIVVPGHAFIGFWSKDTHFSKGLMRNNEEILREMQTIGGHLVPVECTTFTDGKEVSFDQAMEIGMDNLSKIVYVIDVCMSREEGILPVYTYVDKPICEPEKSADPDREGQKPNSKLNRLKQQAMDITVRNNLLAIKKEKSQIAFRLSAKDFFFRGYDDERLYTEMKHELTNRGISEKEIEKSLHALRMTDRDSRREKGQGTLYLALNEMRWNKSDGNKLCSAPLYLCPLEIYKNRRGEHLIRIKWDETRFNPVLQELLIQEFDIDIRDMQDNPGEAYEEQMGVLRYRIGRKNEWAVEENAAYISAFSIPNEAIWNSLQRESVVKHEIVQGILNGRMSWENDLKTENCSDDAPKVYVFQADSSQSEVIRQTMRKKTQVVMGPAGNGKTQTVANIIANEMSFGRKVLFVSEKLSALEVVQDMLKDVKLEHGGNLKNVNLEMFCLSVIEGQRPQEAVYGQLARTLGFLAGYEGIDELADIPTSRYQEIEKKIQNVYQIMRRKDDCGKSLAELLEIYEKYRDFPVNLSWDRARTAMNDENGEMIIEAFAEVSRTCTRIHGDYLEYINTQDLPPAERDVARQNVTEALDTINILKSKVYEMEKQLGFPACDMPDKYRLGRMIQYMSNLRRCPVVGENYSELQERINSAEKTLRAQILKQIGDMKDVSPRSRRFERMRVDLEDLLAIGLKWGEYRVLSQNFDLKEIEARVRGPLYPDVDVAQGAIENLEKYQDVLETIERQTADGDQEVKECLLNAARRIVEGSDPGLPKAAQDIVDVYKQYSKAQRRAQDMLLHDVKEFEEKYPDQLKVVLLEEWSRNENFTEELSAYNRVKEQAQNAGLGSIIEQLEERRASGNLKPEEMMDAFRKCWCRYNIDRIRSLYPELEEFAFVNYKVLLGNYKRFEREIRKAVRNNLIVRQLGRLPRVQEGSANDEELGRLTRIVYTRGRHMTVRAVFERSPHILLDMFPCMLMNPTAAAEYIPDNFPQFDLVIIDEGSQMPTYKALYPISKGKRCLILGDDKQLTPTNFFQKRLEEDDGYVSPVESILEDAVATSMPKRMLKYHYRSENESLIAFSNYRYYNNEIITFPSCSTSIKRVEYLYVEDACYERGGNKTNEKEAECVIEKIREIYHHLPEETEETLGVITMNMPQRNLIQSKLLDSGMEDRILGRAADELISITNLESCQGKEWDHVILSPVFGPDRDGRVWNNLGAISREDGENRLNVMITRARKMMYLVTSLKPEDLNSAHTKGAVNLKDFISYARGERELDTRNRNILQKDSGIKKSVVSALEDRGYTVHTNIGSSSCKVDIGVVSRQDPDRYMMGILLDHFSEWGYHVKDQEIICPEALENKGWNIYRLHSVNWYKNPVYELELIMGFMRSIEDRNVRM